VLRKQAAAAAAAIDALCGKGIRQLTVVTAQIICTEYSNAAAATGTGLAQQSHRATEKPLGNRGRQLYCLSLVLLPYYAA
jgi:hypothetical protein